MPVFPDGYPTDLLEKILNNGGTFTAYHAYRVAKYGLEDPRSFLSTYQEKNIKRCNAEATAKQKTEKPWP